MGRKRRRDRKSQPTTALPPGIESSLFYVGAFAGHAENALAEWHLAHAGLIALRQRRPADPEAIRAAEDLSREWLRLLERADADLTHSLQTLAHDVADLQARVTTLTDAVEALRSRYRDTVPATRPSTN